MTLVVRGGTVVDRSAARQADIVVGDDGRIVALTPAGTTGATSASTNMIDAGGLLVFPGMVDAHVHFQEPGRTSWEGFDTGSAAAAAGGVTTVVDMPIDSDPPTVTAADVKAKAEAAERSSRVDVALWGGLIPGSLDDLAAMAQAGVAGFKAFACPTGWDDFPPVDEVTLLCGLATAARLDLPVAVHCELEPLGHTVLSEVEAVRWAARQAARAGARLHVVHVSSAEAIDEAKLWPGVTTETCPHYLELEEGQGHCAPPIRDRAIREALWARVQTNAVDWVASDHSPCPPSWRDHWAGIDGVGMALPVLLSSDRLPLTDVARLITEAARVLRLPGKGSLDVGADADLVLVDPDAEWTVSYNTQWSRHRQSPYLGRRVKGQVIRTMVRGRTVFLHGDGPSELGGGRFIRPPLLATSPAVRDRTALPR
jgi:allantoinase